MSTTTPETSQPDPKAAPMLLGVPIGSPVETAPSAVLVEGPTFARAVGFLGLFLLTLGGVVIISTRALGPRWVPEGWGFLFGSFGLALMLYWASSDNDQEIRRAFGGFAAFWLLFAVVAAFVPGPFNVVEKTAGFYLLPWGIGAAIISLLFLVPFCRHETDELYRNAAVSTLLGAGGLLCVASVAAGVFRPDFLAGPGLTLALLGLAFLCAYLGQVDTSDGIGYTVAFALGAFGAVVVAYAVGRAAFPTLLYEGPSTLRNPNGSLDVWKTGFRLLGGLVFVVPAILALVSRSPMWLKAATGVVGLAGAGVVVTSLFTNPVLTSPKPFLVPNGLIFIAIGLLYMAVSLGVCSDNQFVTLTRRELSAYFFSPIGYLVLGGMAFVQWNQYRLFLSTLAEAGQQSQAVPEPIVRMMFLDFLPVIALLLQVPALTMRLLAEERRTGSLEVLLTAPVNEWPVVLSKFLATWVFFMLTWLPAGLYLVALRMETGVPFDYRPLLSYYLCVAAQGLAFIGMGLFFSTITKDQIVAAVLAFVGMLIFFLFYLMRRDQLALGLPPVVQTAIGRLSFIHMWVESLSGRLPLRDTLLFASIGAFWVFLSVKVLEARKWT